MKKKHKSFIRVKAEKFTAPTLYRLHPKLKDRIVQYNLFCDGSVRPMVSEAGIGGYVATPEKIEVLYKKSVDYNIYHDSNHCELHSIEHGLSLVCDMGIKEIKVFTDSVNSVNMIGDYLRGTKVNSRYHAVLANIALLLKNLNGYKFCYITRTLNCYADSLTRP